MNIYPETVDEICSLQFKSNSVCDYNFNTFADYFVPKFKKRYKQR